jgi:AbrB family looped-hinge helix DNA binding protein
MMTTMDKAGRIVLPKKIRDELGFVPGDITLTVQGASVVIEPPTGQLEEQDGHLFLASGGHSLTPDELRELRLADQR